MGALRHSSLCFTSVLSPFYSYFTVSDIPMAPFLGPGSTRIPFTHVSIFIAFCAPDLAD
ncbi:hypothetical protein BGX38DRAFT_1166747 [Terfezia claveryi]|nr:hypothetical protein BGX38DRAFT_1166747 [Terfezia claveryi]